MIALSRDLGDDVKRRMFAIRASISQRVLDITAMNICKYLNEAGVVFLHGTAFPLRGGEGYFRVSYALPIERIRN